jgi:hypothetical protein
MCAVTIAAPISDFWAGSSFVGSLRVPILDVLGQAFEPLGQIQQVATHIGVLSPLRETPQLLGDASVIFSCGSLFVAHPAGRAKASAPTDNTSFDRDVPEDDSRSRFCSGA